MLTSTSATHEYQRTRRPAIRSTTGAMISTSPRISSCMNGMLTFSNVSDSGTVNSSRLVPMPERKVQRVGAGMFQPPTAIRCAERHQPEAQTNTTSIAMPMSSVAGRISRPVKGRPSSSLGTVVR